MVDQLNERCGQGAALRTTPHAFARDLRGAISTNSVPLWRLRIGCPGLLVLDDLDRMSTKEYVQRELIYLLDARRNAGQRVAATSRVPVHALPNLHPMLSSRLQSGLCLSLEAPAESAGWDSPSDATRPQAGDSVRRSRIDLAEIVSATARFFSLKQGELKGPARTRTVVLARSFAMYLARQWTQKSFLQIGRFLGGRDHTTVLYNCRKIERLVRSDPQMRGIIRRLNEILSNQDLTWKTR
jgi:chromosomal replication initiation ATPase DnaA